MRCLVDKRIGQKSDHREYPSCDWATIESSISALDGSSNTEVLLDAAGQMSIGGGKTGFYVTFFSLDEAAYALLGDQKKGDAEELMVVGGQKIRVKSRFVVNLQQALQAAKCFFSAPPFTLDSQWELLP